MGIPYIIDYFALPQGAMDTQLYANFYFIFRLNIHDVLSALPFSVVLGISDVVYWVSWVFEIK